MRAERAPLKKSFPGLPACLSNMNDMEISLVFVRSSLSLHLFFHRDVKKDFFLFSAPPTLLMLLDRGCHPWNYRQKSDNKCSRHSDRTFLGLSPLPPSSSFHLWWQEVMWWWMVAVEEDGEKRCHKGAFSLFFCRQGTTTLWKEIEEEVCKEKEDAIL